MREEKKTSQHTFPSANEGNVHIWNGSHTVRHGNSVPV